MSTDMHLSMPAAVSRLLVFAWVKPDNGLIDETSVTILEEKTELHFKVAKYFLDQLGLPFRWQLLVEGKLFNDQVVIFREGLLSTINDPYVKVGRYVVGSIRQRIACLL